MVSGKNTRTIDQHKWAQEYDLATGGWRLATVRYRAIDPRNRSPIVKGQVTILVPIIKNLLVVLRPAAIAWAGTPHTLPVARLDRLATGLAAGLAAGLTAAGALRMEATGRMGATGRIGVTARMEARGRADIFRARRARAFFGAPVAGASER